MSQTDKGKFSPSMRSCLHYMRENGGVICRYPGGFWAKRGWTGRGEQWFGASTIEALATREAGTYTKWQQRTGVSSGSSFPVEFTLSTQAASELRVCRSLNR